ncbi:unnamed protein product [Closterium sp. Yama58-4]|nr:unnamed protein product [Closterium sp. Yama58-4]
MAFKHELAVQLVGPSLVRADVKAERGDVSRWRVAYRVWDAGLYKVVVRSGCGSLNYSASFTHAHEHNMAQWTLAVHPSSKPITSRLPVARVQQGASFSLSETERGDAVADGMLGSACDHGASHGRWLRDGSTGNYSWEFYPCAPPLPPPSHWVSALASGGIREINFVGDSHQRLLMLHLAFLLTHSVNDSHVGYHGDISIAVPDPATAHDTYNTAPRGDDVAASVRGGLREENGVNQQQDQEKQRQFEGLKLNFYWVDGIYQNGQFGCQ